MFFTDKLLTAYIVNGVKMRHIENKKYTTFIHHI